MDVRFLLEEDDAAVQRINVFKNDIARQTNELSAAKQNLLEAEKHRRVCLKDLAERAGRVHVRTRWEIDFVEQSARLHGLRCEVLVESAALLEYANGFGLNARQVQAPNPGHPPA